MLRISRYWDWSLDTVEEADFLNSPVFDATYGFGGTGANITADEKAALFVTSDLVIPGVSLTGGGTYRLLPSPPT